MVEYQSGSHDLVFKVARPINGKTYHDTSFKIDLSDIDERIVQVAIQLSKTLIAFTNGQSIDTGVSKADPMKGEAEKPSQSMLKILHSRLDRIRSKALVEKTTSPSLTDKVQGEAKSNPIDPPVKES
jgi:hypothetical protein